MFTFVPSRLVYRSCKGEESPDNIGRYPSEMEDVCESIGRGEENNSLGLVSR